MFVFKSQKQIFLYFIVVSILFIIYGCNETEPIETPIIDIDDTQLPVVGDTDTPAIDTNGDTHGDADADDDDDDIVEKSTAEQMFEKKILIPAGTLQVVKIKHVELHDFKGGMAINKLILEKDTPLYITREVIFVGDPVFETLEEDNYGNPKDNLISEILKFDLGFIFKESKHLIKKPNTFKVAGFARDFIGYYLPLKDPNGNFTFKPGDEIEVVQDVIWKRETGPMFISSTLRVTRNLTRPEVDYTIFDWDADFIKH